MRGLRTYLKLLEEKVPDQFVTVSDRIDWKYDITSVVTEMEKRKTNPAVLFEDVKDYSMPVLVNLFGHVDRISLGIGETPRVRSRLGFYDEWNRLFGRDIPPVMVNTGPVKEKKSLGNDVDLYSLPIPRFYEQDGGRYITAGLFLARNPKKQEEINLSYVRMHLQGKDRFGVSFHSRGHMWRYLENAKEAGEPMEAAVIIGAHPSLYLAAAAKITDEYHKSGALTGEPVELVKCETVDLPVPADSEIVLEGKVMLEEEDEGPFTEYTGYISGRSTRNLFKVTGILQRKDAMFMAVAPSNSAEHLLLSGLPKQARISKGMMDFIHMPALEDINWPVWATHFACFMSLKEQAMGSTGLAKQIGTLLLGLDHYAKLVAVLPNGTDLSDSAGVLVTIAERCDFKIGSGVDVIGTSYHHLLDPSSVNAGISSKMIIDATGSRRVSENKVDLASVNAIKFIRRVSFPYHGCTALCVINPKRESGELDWVFSEAALSESRMIVLVDEDIDLDDGRQVLWAIATRFQPAENAVIRDGRLVLDARKGDSWTALRATLPFERAT
ncbi:MAG: UbiD family decarboxylase [Candidatus Bathyarchaeota archaeon]|nr:UbiD family decarboxylase [Candidatus Bathyarchaeota archaeon]